MFTDPIAIAGAKAWAKTFPMDRLFYYKSNRGIRYGIKLFCSWQGFWWHVWKPVWHEGRGIYISIGCGYFGFYRGY